MGTYKYPRSNTYPTTIPNAYCMKSWKLPIQLWITQNLTLLMGWSKKNNWSRALYLKGSPRSKTTGYSSPGIRRTQTRIWKIFILTTVFITEQLRIDRPVGAKLYYPSSFPYSLFLIHRRLKRTLRWPSSKRPIQRRRRLLAHPAVVLGQMPDSMLVQQIRLVYLFRCLIEDRLRSLVKRQTGYRLT